MDQRGQDDTQDYGDQPVRRRGTQPPQEPQQAWGQQPQPGYGPPPGYPAQPPAPAPKKKGRKLGLGCLGVVVLVTAIVIGTAIANSGKTSSVTTTPAAGPSGQSTAAPAAKAALGSTVDINGQKNEKLAITLVKIFPNAQGADEFTKPDTGKQFVAVQLRIANASTSVAYSDSPDNCVIVKDASGQQYQADLSSVTAGQSFGSVNITPGDSVLGVVVFQLPVGDSVTQVQYTSDSGFGPGTAQWSAS